MKIFDLSMPIHPTAGDPIPPTIDYSNHDKGAKNLAKFLGVFIEDVPDGKGSATEVVHARTHNGTHMDAPYHYFPTCEGKPSKKIGQIPLEWCFGRGVVLDFHDKPAGYEILVSDVKGALKKISYQIQPFDIVLIRTGADVHYFEKEYSRCHPGMSVEATLWLIEQGVKITGIDAWSWDIPLPMQGEKYIADGRRNKKILWGAHRLGKKHEYCHMEQMGNLDKLPREKDFTIAVFPINVAEAGAGWVRAAALFEDL